jgi:hypothetical protein
MRARNSRTVSAVPSTLIAGRIEVRGTGDQHTIRRVAIMRKVLAAVLIAGASLSLAAQGTSKWVSLGKDRRLHYTADARGNRIIDFSHAGYKGGGVALPNVPVARRLQPSGGDDTPQIQAAIDEVSRLPQNAQGHRGAVQLGAGTYTVAGALKMSASGVVLRGVGSGEGGTTVSVTGPPHRFLEIAGNGSWQPDDRRAAIADAYVPSGADSFDVDSAAIFKAGDAVLVERPVTQAWIQFMKMDVLTRDGKPQVWIAPGTVHSVARTISKVAGRRVTLDVPLSDSYDAEHLKPAGASLVKYTFPGRIEQVGFESMRVAVPARDVPIDQAQYSLLRVAAVSDAWVRDIVVEDTQNTITIAHSARRVTLENVHVRHAVPFTGAASPADFAISGTQILLHRSTVNGTRVWPVVTQAGVTGPNVVLHFKADEAGVAPHQRWATGLLVDSSEFTNGTDRRPGIAFSNREHAGSGHGWSAGWSVAWNVKTDVHLIQQPPGAKNWCIGCTGRPAPILWHGGPIAIPEIPSETFESPGVRVTPPSLYLAQLQDRLGAAAVRNIGYIPR